MQLFYFEWSDIVFLNWIVGLSSHVGSVTHSRNCKTFTFSSANTGVSQSDDFMQAY